MQIISASVEKIIDCHAQKASNGVGDPVVNAAGAQGDEGFLHDFGDRTEHDADGENQPYSLFAVGLTVVVVRFAVAPKRDEGEAEVHEQVDEFVQPEDGLHLGQIRTRQPSQQQDDRCAKDSRVTISSESFQREIT